MGDSCTMKVLDLFSGIGGFSLGLERAGMKTKAFCEVDGFAKRVISKHWPSIPLHDDIRNLHITPQQFDIICGGFPCQDISTAGKGEGLDGERSGLWGEYKRLIKQGQPKYAIIENVTAIRSRGLIRVLQDLWEVGYDAEWHVISASCLGYPHQRERLWIIAYPHSSQLERGSLSRRIQEKISNSGNIRRGEDKPGVERALDGVPSQMDRLRCLGNAVVPSIPQIIGEAIVGVEETLNEEGEPVLWEIPDEGS